jgi:hypothetical protein
LFCSNIFIDISAAVMRQFKVKKLNSGGLERDNLQPPREASQMVLQDTTLREKFKSLLRAGSGSGRGCEAVADANLRSRVSEGRGMR